MPKPYPKEFRDDVVRVARERESGVRIEQIAKDFGVHPMTLTKWMRRADIDDGNRPGLTFPGHWEGDLIIGALGGSAMATVVERSTRFVMLGHLGRNRTAEAVRDSLITTFRDLPASLRGSLTWDQGAEMAEHRALSTATNLDVYFADAGSPWQRRSNENTNGLLRQYFPKGTDLAEHSIEDLLAVSDELNNRPRRSLNWDTPAERMAVLLETG